MNISDVHAGTNTDSVIVDITRRDDPTRGVLASFKHETTPDVTTGIENAVREVLKGSGIHPGSSDIIGLTIGTTVRARFFCRHPYSPVRSTS